MDKIRIDIKQFDMANETVAESVCLYIELADNYLSYSGEYYAQVPVASDPDDHSMGWKDDYTNFTIKIKRSFLVSLDKDWVEKRQIWRIQLEAYGYPNTINFYFKTETEANKVYKILDEYIFV